MGGTFRTTAPRRLRGLYLPTDSSHVQTPDATDLGITGDLELVIHLGREDWTTSNLVFLSKRSSGAGLSWQWGVSNTGGILMSISTGGSAYYSTGNGANPGFVDGLMYWLRMRRVATTGAIEMAYAPDQDEEPGTWTSLTVTGTQQAGAIDTNTAPLEIGAHSSGTGTACDGTYGRAIVRDGIGGTTVADWRGDLPTDPHKDVTGKVWTIGGATGWAWEAA